MTLWFVARRPMWSFCGGSKGQRVSHRGLVGSGRSKTTRMLRYRVRGPVLVLVQLMRFSVIEPLTGESLRDDAGAIAQLAVGPGFPAAELFG
jgi:hypothetical protein